MRGRLLLFQSVDRADAGVVRRHPGGLQQGHRDRRGGDRRTYARFGFEGIRVFDVTDPRKPEYLTAVPTACGSHTHTLVPDKRNQRVLLYVSSYPLGSGVTAPSEAGKADDLVCASPHQKISIVEVTAKAPERASLLREEPLSSDSATYPGAVPGNPKGPFIACHDITVHMATKTALGACAGDAQLWDISDPANPTASDGERHTHIKRPAAGGGPAAQAAADEWEFVHNAVATWDGRYTAFADETGGGGTNECDGSAEERGGQSENGFYYFYPFVRPGDPAPRLLSRYMIPRPQGEEICVMHNGNVVPTNKGYYLVSAAYQGGDTVGGLHRPAQPAGDRLRRPGRRRGVVRLLVDVLVQRPRRHQRRPEPPRAHGQPRSRRGRGAPRGRLAPAGAQPGLPQPADHGGLAGHRTGRPALSRC